VIDGLHELRHGLAAYEATGAKIWRPYFLGFLALALAKADRVQEGLRVAAEALAVIRETGEQGFAAELHRVYGELLLASASSGAVVEAEDCFTRALAIARKQRAKSWELKVATSLCMFTRDREEHGDARRLLRKTSEWFTEGHQTADLKAARAALMAT
jgi:predicted ATPase